MLTTRAAKYASPAITLSCLAGLLGCSGSTANPNGGMPDAPEFVPWELDDVQDADGFSLRVPEFVVPSGHESQNCYFVRVPDLDNNKDIWINRVLTAINPGSHHVTVFRVKTVLDLDPAKGLPTMMGKYPATWVEGGDDYLGNPCWLSGNWGDWPLIANSQESTPGKNTTDWTLPAGVATRLTPGEMLMVQTHYVNTDEQPAKYGGRVGINFYRFKDAAQPIELGTVFAFQTKIRVCASNPRPTYSGTCKFPSAVTIAAANGHFHKRGDTFSISPWDGASTARPEATQNFYKSADWSNPQMKTDLSVPTPAGGGIWYDCSFNWRAPDEVACSDVDAKDPMKANDCCYTFGGITDIGEHCNLFLYYYPKLDTAPICENVAQ